MSNPLDAIPQAVATIVSTCFGPALTGSSKVPGDHFAESEKRIINFADQLTRTLVKAMLDAQAEKT